MSVNNINCCAFGCHSKKGRNKDLSFHSFPQKNKTTVYIENRFGMKEKIDNHKAWMLQLKMGKPATKFMKVCSLHFRREDFILPDFPSKRPRLKSIAVPSQNLPERKVYCEVKQPQRSRILRDCKTGDHMIYENGSGPTISINSQQKQQQTDSVLDSEITAAYALCNLTQMPPLSEILVTKKDQETQVSPEDLMNEMVPKKDQETQVASGDLLVYFRDKIKTDKQLNTMTGIPNYQLFHYIVSVCNDIYGKFSNKHKLNLEDCIMLCFMKMKNGFSYAVLSVLFGNVTQSTCRNIFHETLVMLSKILKPVIYLPSIEEIKLNIPTCFEHFQKVRIVIDCTEIPVQRAKSLKSRLITYSNYKKTHTIKFMTAVTPAGLIAFISKGYGGRHSDKSILEQSGLFEKLEMFRDEIMVDKGFLIQNFAETHFVKVIQPPFLKKQKQFSKNDALGNQKIAKARVHVERVNQRIKIFEIFKKPLPISLWPRVDDIFTIACAIVNLTSSIFNDSRFI